MRRLRAKLLAPEDLQGEVEGLMDLGEEPAAEVVPEYIQSLLETGQGTRAREFIESRKEKLPANVLTRTGWACYKLNAHDLAYELFFRAFNANRKDFRFMAAFEKAASLAGKLPEVIGLYGSRLETDPALHGRMRNLRKRLG